MSHVVDGHVQKALHDEAVASGQTDPGSRYGDSLSGSQHIGEAFRIDTAQDPTGALAE